MGADGVHDVLLKTLEVVLLGIYLGAVLLDKAVKACSAHEDEGLDPSIRHQLVTDSVVVPLDLLGDSHSADRIITILAAVARSN